MKTGRSVLSQLSYVVGIAWRYRKSALVYAALAAVTDAVSALLSLLFPKLVIDELTGAGRFSAVLLILAVSGGGLLLARQAGYWCRNRFTAEYIWFKTIMQAGETCMSMDYGRMADPAVLTQNKRVEDLLKNAGEGVLGIITALTQGLSLLFSFLVSLCILATLQPLLLCLLLPVAALGFLAQRKENQEKFRLENETAAYRRKQRYAWDFMTDYFFGKDLRLFGMNRFLIHGYREEGAKVTEREDGMAAAGFRGQMAVLAAGIAQEAGVYGYLIYRACARALSIGNFLLYASAATSFVDNLKELLRQVAGLIHLCDGMSLVREFLEQKTERETEDMTEKETDKKRSAATGKEKAAEQEKDSIPAFPYEIAFDHVSFRYPGQEQEILKDLSFTLHPGERLALVGMNGAGKTTLTKLIMGLYRPTQGRVLLNGKDIGHFSAKEYFRQFSPVFQTPELYAMSFASNISMCREEETQEERLLRAVRLSGLQGIVDKLPQGSHTQLLRTLDENGVELSGGEKQRLAIARAVYKDAPVMILDEPSSALDPLAEQALYREFDNLAAGKTTLFISHRLASVAFCDRVALLKDGHLAEYGTHEELMRFGGEYCAMYEAQAKYYREGRDEAHV